MLGDLGVDEFAAMASEPRESASLVLSHEARITGDIGGENGRKTPLDPLSAQMLSPRTRLVENSKPPPQLIER